MQARLPREKYFDAQAAHAASCCVPLPWRRRVGLARDNVAKSDSCEKPHLIETGDKAGSSKNEKENHKHPLRPWCPFLSEVNSFFSV